ncbi:MAG: ABC transporter permease, partial [Longimicrobiales bacterium]
MVEQPPAVDGGRPVAPALYRWLIRLFPRDFRERFGAEMEAVFVERLREAGRASVRAPLPVRFLARLSGRLEVWARGVIDVLAHALAEQASRRPRAGPRGVPSPGAAASGGPIRFGGAGMESMLQDLRFAFRGLRRSPGFTAVAVATLALGIGASTVVFSVLHSVLWRPLPYPAGDRLVVVRAEIRGVANVGLAPGEVLEVRARMRSLDALETVNGVHANVEVEGEHAFVPAASVTDGFLELLGVTRPALGRTLREDEDIGDPYVTGAVISDGLWRRSFGGDANVVGRRVQINNLDLRIVGVLPAGFRVFLPPDNLAAEEIGVWFPTHLEDTRSSRGFPALGRLTPGATLAAAQAELDALAAQLVAEHPSDYLGGDLRLTASLLADDLTADVRPALFVLAVAVGFVLLIACLNVANLLLARGKAREREIAVRHALGASRGRVVRQMLTESLVLAAGAAVLGLGLGTIGVSLVDWLRPVHLPRQSQIALDGTVVLFSVALSMVTALLFGVLPALRLSSGRGGNRLTAGRTETAARPMRRLQRALVVGQVALSIVPLVGAGLMLRTFGNLLDVPLGFDPTDVLTAHVAMSFRDFPDPEKRWVVFDQHILPAIRALPGVRDVSAGAPVPFGPYQSTERYGGDDDPSAPLSRATQQSILPGYLRVMGIPLRAGRDFTIGDLEANRPVAIVDERIARQLWPSGAVGERLVIETGRDRRETLEIVGVTDAVRVTGVRDDNLPHFFVPSPRHGIELTLVIKTAGGGAALGPAIQRIVEPHTGRAVHDIRPLSEYVAESIVDVRFNLLVLLGFAAASLMLAGVGLHGTLAYLISQRTRELGLRVALGATARRVIRMVVGEGSLLVGLGAA